MKFGIQDKIFYDEYLSNHVCTSCQKAFSTKLVIYCKVLATGFAWWAWKKQGYIECNNCGTVSDVKPAQYHSKEIRAAFSMKSLPFHYFLPAVSFGLIIALITLGIGARLLAEATTTTHDRFAGIWQDRSHNYSLFVFPDNHYTIITGDTILFGNYAIDNTTDYISMPVTNQANGFSRLDPNNLPVSINRYEEGQFVKVLSHLRGDNPYQLKHNHWRVKAKHDESPAEVKMRVLGYLKYLQLRYRWAIRNKLYTLPPDLYSPILQGQNGIAITEYSLNNWAPVFHNQNDLEVANRFLYVTFPNDIPYDEKEPSVYIRNLKGIDHYIQVAEATAIK